MTDETVVDGRATSRTSSSAGCTGRSVGGARWHVKKRLTRRSGTAAGGRCRSADCTFWSNAPAATWMFSLFRDQRSASPGLAGQACRPGGGYSPVGAFQRNQRGVRASGWSERARESRQFRCRPGAGVAVVHVVYGKVQRLISRPVSRGRSGSGRSSRPSSAPRPVSGACPAHGFSQDLCRRWSFPFWSSSTRCRSS